MNAEKARALLKEKQQSKLNEENNNLADILTWLENNYEQYIIEAINKNYNEQKCQVSFIIPVSKMGFSNNFIQDRYFNRVKNSIITFFDNLGFSSIRVKPYFAEGSSHFYSIQVMIKLD